MLLFAVGFIILVVTPAVLKSSDIPAPSILIAPLVTEEVLNELIAVAPEQEIPNADELFNAAMETSEERIAKELEIESMTPEQLQAEFGWSLSEAVGIMREAVINSKTHHADAINLMLDKIESLSK